MTTKTDSIWAAAEHLLRRDEEELRRALADLPKIEPWFVVNPPWGRGDFIVSGHPDPHLGRYIADTEDFDGEGEHVLEHAAFIAAANPATVQKLLAELDELRAAREGKAAYDEHIAAADALASLSTVAAALPPSYLGGSLVANGATGECVVRMHFGNAKEAERWFDAATDSREAAPKAAPAPTTQPAPAAAAPKDIQMPEMWHVDTHVLGEKILSIGNDWLSGKDELTEAEEQAVIGMAQTLLSFVGYGMPPSSFDPDADDDDGQAQRDQEVGRQWRLNSSLEKWFPLTAERLERLQAAFAARVDASEREAFEAQFPVPGGVNWNGSEYVVEDDCLNSYRCDRFVGQWAAWQARAARGQAPAPAALLYEHEDGRCAVNPDTAGDPKWHRIGPVDVSALISAPTTKAAPAHPILAKKHTSSKVDYRGLLGQCQSVLHRHGGSGYAEMLRQLEGHMTELGQRWYAGDPAVVDELLQLYCVEHEAREALAAHPAAPAAQGDALDAAFEAVRQRLCGIQRYSFLLADDGGVRRVQDRTGSWIEFDAAHELFDPVAVDAARAAKEGAKHGNPHD